MTYYLELSMKDKNKMDFIFTTTLLNRYSPKTDRAISEIKVNYNKDNPIIPIVSVYCEKDNIVYEKERLYNKLTKEINKNLKVVIKNLFSLEENTAINCHRTKSLSWEK